MAHFHIPKPLHGWRAFVGEVGIIVLGVLIALGAEQVAETIHNRRVAADTRQSVKEELETGLGALSLRNTAEPCIARRLAELRSILVQWARNGTFKAPSWVAQAPGFGIEFSAYQASLGSGRIALLPSEEQFRIGSMMERLHSFSDIQNQEVDQWAKLRLLQAGPDVLTSTDRTMIWEALETASTLDYSARLRIRQALPRGQQFGFRPDMRRFKQGASNIWKSGRATPSICVDISTPPAQANEQSGQVVPLPQ